MCTFTLFIYLFIHGKIFSITLHKKNNNTVLQDCRVGPRLTIAFIKWVDFPFKTSKTFCWMCGIFLYISSLSVAVQVSLMFISDLWL